MRNKPGLEDKEQALIDAALRELAARKATTTRPEPRAPVTPTTTRKGSTAAQPRKPVPSGPTTPVDHPTVDGWNHPSARDAAPAVKIAAEEKWARMAAAMEAEQRESRDTRERMRRLGRRFAIGVTVFILLMVIAFLR